MVHIYACFIHVICFELACDYVEYITKTRILRFHGTFERKSLRSVPEIDFSMFSTIFEYAESNADRC